jgi:adenylate cyclase
VKVTVPDTSSGKAEDHNRVRLDRLEHREWQLWSLAIVAILWLTLGILLTPLPRWLTAERVFDLDPGYGSGLYYLGLVVLILCLCLYLRNSYRDIRDLRGHLFETRSEIREMALDLEGLRSLYKVTASLGSQMNLSFLLSMIAREAVTAVGAHQSSLMLVEKDRQGLKTVATFGTEEPEIRDARSALGEGVAGWVALHGKPRLLHGPLPREVFAGFIPKERPISSAVCVPLQIKSRTIGVLNVNLQNTERQFSDNELRLLMIFANHAAVAIRNAMLFKEIQQTSRLRTILEGCVSPSVAEVLMKNPRGWVNVGEIKTVTVLFADIRGFTPVVHRLGPEKTRLFLNQFFTRMSGILFQYQGTLDKFIGDSVLAFFGAPLAVEEPALRAFEAATAMIDSFEHLRSRWERHSAEVARLALGVGLSTGRVFVGNVGSPSRFDYTVIGRDVNIAKRLCDRAEGGQVLVTEGTRQALSARIPSRPLGAMRFKGLSKPVEVFELRANSKVR